MVPNIGHEPGPELERALREYVKQELAPYKYPRWIEFVSELPKGPTGKAAAKAIELLGVTPTVKTEPQASK